MKNYTYQLLFFFALISFSFANAQAPFIQWEKTFGSTYSEQANCSQQTTDGGYIVAGSANNNSGDVAGNHGGYDFWVVKISPAGTIQWQQCYGGSNDDIAYCIQQTTDGGYIVSGSTVSGDGQVTGLHPSPGNPLWGDYWIIKIDSAGVLQWQKTLGGTGFDEAHSITQTAEGGYIVAGVTNSGDGDFTNGGNIVKLSSIGAIQWNSYQGGSFNYSVKQTTDGGYIVTGTILNQVSVLKLDSLGVHQWWKFYGGSNWDIGNSIIQTTDGGYIVAGYTESGDGDVTGFHGGVADAWLIKVDSSGDLQWEKALGGSYDDEANSIKQTTDGGYIFVGVTNSDDGDVSGLHGVAGANSANGSIPDYWVVKINSVGNIQWQKPMGSSYIEQGVSIEETTDGGYIVAGSTANNVANDGDVTGFHVEPTNPNASGFDYWIVKLAPEIATTYSASIAQTASVLCNGQSGAALTVSVTGSAAPYTYSWSPSISTSSVATGLAAGVYTCLVTSAISATTISTYTITEPSATIITANATNSVLCSGSTTTLNGAGANTYTWTGGVTNGVAFSPSATNSYTVYGTDLNGCSASASISVTVNSLPSVTVIASPSSTVCAGTPLTLSGGGATTYSWTGGVTNGVAFTPTSSASYTVTGTDVNGCVNTAIQSITISNSPTVTANVTNSVICSGMPVTLTGGGAVTYTWTNGVINSVAFIPTNTITYTVTGADAAGCTNRAVKTITVNPLPTPGITTTATLICKGQTAMLTASGAVSYTWSTNQSVSAISVSPTIITTYTVSGTGSNGCINSVAFTQNVSDCTGIESFSGTTLEVNSYPNPNNGEFTIVSNLDVNLNLINSIGKLVRVIQLSNTNDHRVKLEGLSQGVYILTEQNLPRTVQQKIMVIK